MLVLSRQKNETIMVGDDIEITIVDIKGDNVRLGITAPRSIPVHRKEVYLAIQAENLAAASAHVDPAALAGLPAFAGATPPRPGSTEPTRGVRIPAERPSRADAASSDPPPEARSSVASRGDAASPRTRPDKGTRTTRKKKETRTS